MFGEMGRVTLQIYPLVYDLDLKMFCSSEFTNW